MGQRRKGPVTGSARDGGPKLGAGNRQPKRQAKPVGQRGRHFGEPGHPPELGLLHQWQKGQSGNPEGPPARKRIAGALKAAIRELGALPMPEHWRPGDKDLCEGTTNNAALAIMLHRGAAMGDRFCIDQILKLEPAEVVMDVDFTEVGLEDRLDALAQQGNEASVSGKSKPNGSNGAGPDHQ